MPQEQPPPRKENVGFIRQFALATELPFLLAGGVLAGGLLGYLLDQWWHTKPYVMLLLGTVGFFAALRDMLRRLQKNGSSKAPNP